MSNTNELLIKLVLRQNYTLPPCVNIIRIGVSAALLLGDVTIISDDFVIMNRDIFWTPSRMITNWKTFSRLHRKLYCGYIESTSALCTFTYYAGKWCLTHSILAGLRDFHPCPWFFIWFWATSSNAGDVIRMPIACLLLI